jgi:HSP20 family protein
VGPSARPETFEFYHSHDAIDQFAAPPSRRGTRRCVATLREAWYDRVMPCDPLADLRAWQVRLERLTRHHTESWAPAVDVYETDGLYVVTAEVPGLSREQIDLAAEDFRLTIQGRREADPITAGGGAVHFHQVERGHGSFRRTFEFSAKIDPDQITADLTDGVLTISIPKVPPPAARRIEVR